jgi:antitoxin component of MazEF toxin-antitoxin module
MTTRPIRINGRLAVVIPDTIAFELQIHEDSPLSLEVAGTRIIITAHRQSDHDARFEAALEDFNRRRGNVLRRLAEGPE